MNKDLLLLAFVAIIMIGFISSCAIYENKAKKKMFDDINIATNSVVSVGVGTQHDISLDIKCETVGTNKVYTIVGVREIKL